MSDSCSVYVGTPTPTQETDVTESTEESYNRKQKRSDDSVINGIIGAAIMLAVVMCGYFGLKYYEKWKQLRAYETISTTPDTHGEMKRQELHIQMSGISPIIYCIFCCGVCC